MDELKEAIKVINNGLSIENIIFAGEEFLHHLLDLINNIIAQNSIPELVKVGHFCLRYIRTRERKMTQRIIGE